MFLNELSHFNTPMPEQQFPKLPIKITKNLLNDGNFPVPVATQKATDTTLIVSLTAHTLPFIIFTNKKNRLNINDLNGFSKPCFTQLFLKYFMI